MEFAHPEDRGRLLDSRSPGQLHSAVPFDETVRFQHQDGSTRWLRIRGRALGDSGPEAKRWLGTLTDVTEAHAAAEEVVHTEEHLLRFAHSAAHDIKGPLRSVGAYLEMLTEDFGEQLTEEAGRMLGAAQKAGVRAGKLVDNLVKYSKLDAPDLPMQEVDLAELVDHLRKDMAAELEAAGAELTVGELPKVEGNPLLLVQILRNLLSNAVTYGREGVANSIGLTCAESEGEWVFAVKDQGIGIPSQHQDEVFNLFRRLHSWADIAGTGLGLNIAQKAAERMGGRVWLESKEGEGSTFFASIPKGGAAQG